MLVCESMLRNLMQLINAYSCYLFTLLFEHTMFLCVRYSQPASESQPHNTYIFRTVEPVHKNNLQIEIEMIQKYLASTSVMLHHWTISTCSLSRGKIQFSSHHDRKTSQGSALQSCRNATESTWNILAISLNASSLKSICFHVQIPWVKLFQNVKRRTCLSWDRCLEVFPRALIWVCCRFLIISVYLFIVQSLSRRSRLLSEAADTLQAPPLPMCQPRFCLTSDMGRELQQREG